jgi:hypothetical protein
MMKKILFLFFALILLLSFVQQQSDLIFWNTKRPLRFEDFKAVQKDTIQIGNTGRFKGAQSQLKFKFNTSQSSYTTTPKIEVLVYFNPNDSWMLIKDERTLEHEQIHFNIAELYARKMRKSIDSLSKLNVYDFQIYKDKIYDWNKKYDNCNILFDQEIDDRVYYLNGKFLSHKDKGQQKKWKEKVDVELKILEKF